MPLLFLSYQIAAFVIGLCLGSFLNVAVWRIPRDLSVWWPPSHCPSCETPIAPSDNVPLLSWLILGARCRHCSAPIAATYPLVELTGGLFGWLAFRRCVPSPERLDVAHVAASVWIYLFIWLLLLAAYTDIRSRIIPEVASIYAVPFGIAGAFALNTLGYLAAPDWRLCVLGAATAWLFFGGLSVLFRFLLGREGLGWGDVRLASMVGAWLGPGGLFLVLLLASFIGAPASMAALVLSRGSVYLPFGPWIAVAGITVALYGEPLVHALFPGLAMFY